MRASNVMRLSRGILSSGDSVEREAGGDAGGVHSEQNGREGEEPLPWEAANNSDAGRGERFEHASEPGEGRGAFGERAGTERFGRAGREIDCAGEHEGECDEEDGLSVARPGSEGLLVPWRVLARGNGGENIRDQRVGCFALGQLFELLIDELFQFGLFGRFHIRWASKGWQARD